IPDRIALAFEHESLTYAAYNQEVNRVAGTLRRAGVVQGTPVAILCVNSPLFLATLGAVAKLGAVGALINLHVRRAGLTSVLRASGAAVGVCDGDALADLAAVRGTHPVRFLADAAAASLPADVRRLRDAPPRADRPTLPDARRGHDFLSLDTPAPPRH